MDNMYFITKRGSATGKKFAILEAKMDAAKAAQVAFAKKYGFKQWRHAHWCVAGGMSSCIGFAKVPDSKIWGKGAERGEYMPKENSNAGKSV